MKEEVMIWGKTYPNLSDTHQETVCTGGSIVATGQPVRLYPIRHRYLPEMERFSLFDVVQMDIQDSTKDSRPESCRLVHPRIEKLYHVPSTNGWIERHRIIYRDTSWHYGCLERLHEERERGDASLGFVPVGSLEGAEAEPRSDEEREEHEEKLARIKAQLDLLEGEVKDLDFFPYRFRVRWRCRTSDCPGHHGQVLDWGLYQLARRRGVRKAVEKLEDLGDVERYDLHFFMGNYKAHQQYFGVVALWYPLRTELEQALQQGSLL